MQLLILSQDNIQIAEYEAISLLSLKEYQRFDQILICNIENPHLRKNHKKYMESIKKLAYTKKAYDILFDCQIPNLKDALLKYDFKSIYKKNFCLRIHNPDKKVKLEEPEYAIPIWRSLAENKILPKVDLDNPKTTIEIFIIGKNAIVCNLLWTNVSDFESRQAHLRPIIIPTAMHPKLARALVNIVAKDNIIDPFCGAGGILVEAGLLGLKFKGSDIDKNILNIAKKNLRHEKINPRNYTLRIQDATKLNSLRNVVTDLPYGKSSKKTDEIITLYGKFVKNISGRAVIVFPDFVDFQSILKNNLNKSLHIEKILTNYVHKSLTRIIIVIDKKKAIAKK